MPVRVVPTLVTVLLGLACLMVGCGDETGLDVAEGRYRLVVEGHLADTLSGSAVVHDRRHGHVGLELGPPEGPGLSIELAAPPPDTGAPSLAARLRPGRYDVVPAPLLEASPADSLTGLLAFLSVAGTEFAATGGHLSLTHVGPGTVAGRLDLEMTEQGDEALGGRTVRVTGVLHATAP